METFEETSRITNVSATMFPSLPWALQMKNRLKISLLITKLSISQHIYVRYDIIRNISFNLR